MSSPGSSAEPDQVEKPLVRMEMKRPNGWRHISSYELLAGRRELVIMHSGELYLLRVTSKGKLILTK